MPADELLQFKCLSDLQKIIEELEIRIAEQQKGKLLTRPIKEGMHPTLYPERNEGKYRTVMGIRICDYKFSSDECWVLPDDQWGL